MKPGHRARYAPARATAFAVAGVMAAVLLLATSDPAIAASCSGASHDAPVLSAGKASPSSGTTATTITFSVRYSDSAGCAPTKIEVVIAGLGRYRMSSSGTAFASGVTYRVARKLPVGSWKYTFAVTSGSGQGKRSVTLSAVSPSRVVIKAPAPKPTPRPTPKPTPALTAPPTPAAVVTPVPSAPPTEPPGASPSASGSPSATPGHVAVGGSGRPGAGGGSVGGAIGGQRTPGPAAPNAWSSMVGIATGIGAPVVAWSLTTALGILVFAAFLLLPRPRRRVPARAGSAGATLAVAAAVPAANAAPTPTVTGLPSTGGGADAGAESAAPAGPHQPVLFRSRPRRGTERRTIAYRLVRLSDAPDDFRSHEIGRLDRGDQVEVIGEHEGFLRVRTPSGQEGWVPRVVIVG